MSWVSPTGFVDGGGTWGQETFAYDEDISTFAYTNNAKGVWTDYLELTHSAIDCDKIRIWVDRGFTNVTSFEIDVYYSGAWHNIFSGAANWGEWQEHAIGSTQLVTAMRVRFFATKAGAATSTVYEADFNEVELAAYYHGLKVQGEGELALCDVGSHPLRVRKGGTTYGIELVATDDSNASKVRVKTPAGIKSIRKYA